MPVPPQLALFPDTAFPHPAQRPTPLAGQARLPATESLTIRPQTLPSGVQWHYITLDGHTIGYQLKRSRRRTVGLTINDSGLTVSVPAWVKLNQTEQALQHKAAWIVRKLQEYKARREQLALNTLRWQDGDCLPYMGASIQLTLDPSAQQASFSGQALAPRNSDRLHLPLPLSADSRRVQELTQAWLQQQAAHWFAQRLEHYQQMAGLNARRLRLAAPAKRWGSCSSDGTIMLNWRLIHFEPAIIDYVVAHEVAHLQEMNHGPRFWALVEALYPDFMHARNQLRQHDPGTLPLL
ncbi:M48 family metallopeptidase [Alcaligenes sp. SDU_A2]|uniref:M48 family metallopeptidase n=1 Tax=Alcaligenes sp. SDU_A2 TaxID=3136634 RepID=UPI0031203DFD